MKVTINGEELELARLETIDNDEHDLMYRQSGITLDQFAINPDSPEEEAQLTEKLRNPGFIRCMCHITYQRAHPELTEAQVKKVIGGENAMEMMVKYLEALAEEEVEEEVPPVSGQDKSVLPVSNGSSNGHSGETSETGSENPADPQESTGTTGSGTSATLARVI